MVPYGNNPTTAGDLNKGMAEIVEITAAPTISQPRIEHLRKYQVWRHKSQHNPWDDEMTDGDSVRLSSEGLTDFSMCVYAKSLDWCFRVLQRNCDKPIVVAACRRSLGS
jgi:hypothetical protein